MPAEDIAVKQNNDLPKPQKGNSNNPASSPYIAVTQTSDYNITQFKKRRAR